MGLRCLTISVVLVTKQRQTSAFQQLYFSTTCPFLKFFRTSWDQPRYLSDLWCLHRYLGQVAPVMCRHQPVGANTFSFFFFSICGLEEEYNFIVRSVQNDDDRWSLLLSMTKRFLKVSNLWRSFHTNPASPSPATIWTFFVVCLARRYRLACGYAASLKLVCMELCSSYPFIAHSDNALFVAICLVMRVLVSSLFIWHFACSAS